MKHTALVFAIILLSAGAVLAQNDDVRVIVGFNGDTDASVFANNGGQAGISIRSANAVAGVLPPGRIAAVKADPNVAYVEEDGIVTALGIDSGDPEIQWGVDRIDSE